MPRRPAAVTQADIARALRAAKAAGGDWRVEIEGSVIRVVPSAPPPPPAADAPGEPLASTLGFVP